MAMETFNFKVERDIGFKIEYRVVETQFGDGYAQISTDGINNKNESYTITANGKEPQARQIMAFFDRHKGSKSFFWTPPLGELGLYTCKDPTPSYKGGGFYTISATFIKVFANMGR